MAYRRRHGISRSSTFKEEIHHPPPDDNHNQTKTFTSSNSFSSSSSPPISLAAQAIPASSAVRKTDSLVFTADSDFDPSRSKGFNAYEDSRNDSKGFWGVLARKAKAILDDNTISEQFETPARVGSSHMLDASTASQNQDQQPTEGFRRMDNPTIRRGLDKLTSSLNQIGDTFEKAFEEGRTIVESKTQDIIQETRKLQIRRKGSSPVAENQVNSFNSTLQQPLVQPTQLQNQTNHETQLKASRDVAMATAAKAKLLLRELKTVKADLAFEKERCAQLEEENKLLRESRVKGGNPADDDLIRLQLETLLAEKARLARENSIYARENRFLREIVEYHQLTMQDVVYLDEGAEEVTEVYPINFPSSKMLSDYPPSPKSPSEVEIEVEDTLSTSSTPTKETLPLEEAKDASNSKSHVSLPPTPATSPPDVDDARRPPLSSYHI
ncbi:uncharacterized protein LOC111307587 [Durio zibethinus]|uniref:Uncharacterized protein LOC111307587 n=1 Tax=Durio zibethinus TaxID=66656 RepID=A0A6P6A8Z3_DURZI|nr:uncharacterized protein LOC111307587 [Durio zibethinus]